MMLTFSIEAGYLLPYCLTRDALLPVQLIMPRRFADDRGWFAETYNARRLSEIGIEIVFRQDNHSLSRIAGTVRGLHCQVPPNVQAKLVRCVAGSIWDVAVDVRQGSPTYGQWVGATLSAQNARQLYIPEGFAHGFMTMEPNTEVLYKTSDYYTPECELGIAWDDHDLALSWPLPADRAVLSEKDRHQPRFASFDSPFSYNGQPLMPLVN